MLQPTIYIGIGGFGLRAISQTKKLFEDEYGVGNIPGRVAFIGIDFDSLEINNSQFPTDISDDCIVLDSATIRSSRDYYARLKHANVSNWMFEMNESLLTDSNHGARQARTTGRLLAELFLQRIEWKVEYCLNQVLAINNAYSGLGGVVDVQIVTSLAGGAGAGSFLTVAAFLKQKFQNRVNIVGYGLLHGVYREMDRGPGTMRVASNAYASILELDFFQSAQFSNPVKFNLAGKEYSFDEPLFDDFFVIDNRTCHGNVLDLQTLYERLGQSLYMNARTAFRIFAIDSLWKTGRFDVKNKIGWASSLGASSIVYDGEKLAKAYSYKAAIAICKLLKHGRVSADFDECLLWMRDVGLVDSSEELFPLLDSIMPSSEIATLRSPMLDVAMSFSENMKTLSEYLRAANEQPHTDDIVSGKVASLVELLRGKVDDWVMRDYGIEGTKRMLLTVKLILGQKLGDVSHEVNALNDMVDRYTNMISDGWCEYDRFTRSILPRTLSRKQEMLEECVGYPARQLLRYNYEIRRRSEACRILDLLISHIDSLGIQIDEQIRSLDKNISRCEGDVSKLYAFNSSFLEIDLAHEELMGMEVDPDGLFVSDFFYAEKFDVSDIAGDDFYEKLLAFTYSLPKAEAYKNTTVLDVIDALPQDRYELLKHDAYLNSVSLMRLHGRGLITCINMPVEEAMYKEVRVLMLERFGKPSRLEQDKLLFNDFNGYVRIEKTRADSAKKRVSISMLERGYIPYCIESLNTSVEREYSSCICDSAHPYNPHIGEDVYGQIQNSNFSLKPDFD